MPPRRAAGSSTGIALDGRIYEFLDFCKIHDFIELALHLFFSHSKDGAVEVDVLAPGQLRVKARAHLQQAGNSPLHSHVAAGGRRHSRKDFKQSAFPRAIAPRACPERSEGIPITSPCSTVKLTSFNAQMVSPLEDGRPETGDGDCPILSKGLAARCRVP